MKNIAIIALTALLGFAGSASAELITCNSEDHERNFCRINTAGGVKLVNQLSHAGCWEGDTWGALRGGIWVANGCRAVFRVGYAGSERSHTIHYNHGSERNLNWDDPQEVRDWERQHGDERSSNVGKALGAALAIGVLAAAAEHHNDHDDDYDDYRGGYRGRSVYRCESQDDDYRYCAIGQRFHHAEVKRQLSRSGCRYQRDWGYDRRGIWVNHGCRAEFWVR